MQNPSTDNKPKIRKAVVTDAGYATRFFPITKTVPKCMLPLGDKPTSHHVIEECMSAGIKEIIIVATEEGRTFYEDYFHNTVQHIYEQMKRQNKEKRFEKISQVFSLPNIIVISQDRNLPYGNGTPALCAKPYVGNEPFLYVYADDIVIGKSACKELVEEYENTKEEISGIIAGKEFETIDVTKYGMIKLKDGTSNQLDFIVEKPEPKDAPKPYIASFGRYLLTPLIFDYLAPTKENLGLDGELWATDAIHRMAKDTKVLVKPISGEWRTTGDPVNYMQTMIEYALRDPEYNGKFKEYLKKVASEI